MRDSVSTISGHSMKWILQGRRLLVPEELFNLQEYNLNLHGIFPTPSALSFSGHIPDDSDIWRSSDLVSMAGNAFQGSAMASCLVSAATMYGHALQLHAME